MTGVEPEKKIKYPITYLIECVNHKVTITKTTGEKLVAILVSFDSHFNMVLNFKGKEKLLHGRNIDEIEKV